MLFRAVSLFMLALMLPSLADAADFQEFGRKKSGAVPQRSYVTSLYISPVVPGENRMGMLGTAEIQNHKSRSVSTFAGVRFLKAMESAGNLGVQPDKDIDYDHAAALIGLRIRW